MEVSKEEEMYIIGAFGLLKLHSKIIKTLLDLSTVNSVPSPYLSGKQLNNLPQIMVDHIPQTNCLLTKDTTHSSTH